MLYAVYIVMIKRRVEREDKLDIPMFFGKAKLFFFFACAVWKSASGDVLVASDN